MVTRQLQLPSRLMYVCRGRSKSLHRTRKSLIHVCTVVLSTVRYNVFSRGRTTTKINLKIEPIQRYQTSHARRAQIRKGISIAIYLYINLINRQFTTECNIHFINDKGNATMDYSFKFHHFHFFTVN